MKKLIIPVLALAALTSCEKTTDPSPASSTDPQIIRLSAGVTTVTASTKAIVNGTSFSADTKIGLYAISGNSTYTWGTDLLYNNDGTVTVNATDQSIGIKDAKGQTVNLYYPADGNTVKFFAYHPAVADAQLTKPVDGTPAKAAYTLTGQEDIMHATAVSASLNDDDLTNATVNLAFKHKLAKVNFKIVADASFSTTGNLTNITISNTQTTASLDIDKGDLSFSGDNKDIIAFNDTKSMTEATANPQPVFGDVMIQPGVSYDVKITVNGITYTVTGITSPAAGIANTVVLTFQGSEVNATTSITDWGKPTEVPVNVKK